jgi:hypothetical protein
MPIYNNVEQEKTSRLIGSGLLKIGAYAASPAWINVGPIDDCEYDEGLKITKLESANTEPEEFVSDQETVVKFSIFEVLAERINDILRSGFDDKIVTAGTLTSATKTFDHTAIKANVLYLLDVQNADASKQTISTATVSGSPYTDYSQAQDGSGRWGVLFTTVPSADAIFSYSATPAAEVTYNFGANNNLPYVCLWIYAKNNGNGTDYVFYKGQLKEGTKIQLKKDGDADPRAKADVSLVFTNDNLYHVSPTNHNGYVFSRKQRKGAI